MSRLMSEDEGLRPQSVGYNDQELSVLDLLNLVWRGKWLILVCVMLALFGARMYLNITLPKYEAKGLLNASGGGGRDLASWGGDLAGLSGIAGGKAAVKHLLSSQSLLVKVVRQLRADIHLRKLGGVTDYWNNPNSCSPAPQVALWRPQGKTLIEIKLFDVTQEYFNHPFELTVTSNAQWTLTSNQQVLAQGNAQTTMPFAINGQAGQIAVGQVFSGAEGVYTLKKCPADQIVAAFEKRMSFEEKGGKNSPLVGVSLVDTSPRFAASLLGRLMDQFIADQNRKTKVRTEKNLRLVEEVLPNMRNKLDRTTKEMSQFLQSNRVVNIDEQAKQLIEKKGLLDRKRIEIEVLLKDIEQKYTAQHPAILSARLQLDEIKRESQKIEAIMVGFPKLGESFRRFERDSKIEADLYARTYVQTQQMAISNAFDMSNNEIIDYPTVPTLIKSPKKIQVWVGALLLGVLMGVFLNFLRPSILRQLLSRTNWRE